MYPIQLCNFAFFLRWKRQNVSFTCKPSIIFDITIFLFNLHHLCANKKGHYLGAIKSAHCLKVENLGDLVALLIESGWHTRNNEPFHGVFVVT